MNMFSSCIRLTFPCRLFRQKYAGDRNRAFALPNVFDIFCLNKLWSYLTIKDAEVANLAQPGKYGRVHSKR